MRTVYTGVVRVKGKDHLFHTWYSSPSERYMIMACSLRVEGKAEMRGNVMVPGDHWNPCLECQTLPPYFPS